MNPDSDKMHAPASPLRERGFAVPVFMGMTLLRFMLGFAWRENGVRHAVDPRFRGNGGVSASGNDRKRARE